MPATDTQPALRHTEPELASPNVSLPISHDRRMAAQPMAAPTPPPIYPRPSEDWLRRVCLGYLEAMHGARSPQQLRNVLSAHVASELLKRRQVHQSRAGTPTLVQFKVTQPVATGIELSATFRMAGRCHPVAIRLDQIETRWLVTACEIGSYR